MKKCSKLASLLAIGLFAVNVNACKRTTPEIFVTVKGKTFNGTETWKPESKVFVSGRAITIRDLIVSDHEVTQKEYETYCNYGDDMPSKSYGKGDNFPAYYVNWYDAIVYCNLRSIAENLDPVYKLGTESDPKKWDGIVSADGKYCGPAEINSQWDAITMDIEANGYRLPTVAEWEYLARGDENHGYGYPGGNIVSVAWYKAYSDGKTHKVKGKIPNSFRLYDMAGNVDELCWDWDDYRDVTSTTPETGVPSGLGRCRRGGNWNSSPYACAINFSNSIAPDNRNEYDGFRVVRTAVK